MLLSVAVIAGGYRRAGGGVDDSSRAVAVGYFLAVLSSGWAALAAWWSSL